MGEEWIEFRAKIGTGGRITIRKEIRESENLKRGDYLDVKIKKVKEGVK